MAAAPVGLDLEVARAMPGAHGELRDDAPAKVLEGVASRVPGREDRRTKSLEVAVYVAGDRAEVMGGHDATAVTSASVYGLLSW